MPIYEYLCDHCQLRFELKRRFSEDGGESCPQCGCEARRLFSPAAIIFKGPGFYVTDSRNKSPNSSGGDKVETSKKSESN
jgi:putative FmdB family regulatory protein